MVHNLRENGVREDLLFETIDQNLAIIQFGPDRRVAYVNGIFF